MSTEATLDTATSAAELIPGDPDAVQTRAEHLLTLAAGLHTAGNQLATHLAVPEWSGTAADAFRTATAATPRTATALGDVLDSIGTTLQPYAEVLRQSQVDADHALALHHQAATVTQNAALTHQAAVSRYNTRAQIYNLTGAGTMPTAPGPFLDPGAGPRNEAAAMLYAARERLRQAAATMHDALRTAQAALPTTAGAVVPAITTTDTDTTAGQDKPAHSSVPGPRSGRPSAAAVRAMAEVDPFAPGSDPAAFAGRVDQLCARLTTTATLPLATNEDTPSWQDWAAHPDRVISSLSPATEAR